MENLDREIKLLISKIAKVPEEKVNNDANLFSDLGVDSLIGVEIFAALDKKYGLNIPEDKLKDVQTVYGVISLVKGLKG